MESRRSVNPMRPLNAFRRDGRKERENSTKFDYSPLKPGRIRILRLDPGKRGDALTGKLITAKLNKRVVEYDALSYMWGNHAPTDVIWISGKALPIASNLESALVYLRYEEKPLVIWIDAICIDQSNDIERAEQVQLMRRLYRDAKVVRIWINGPYIDSSSEAIVALRNLELKSFKGSVPHIDDVFEALGDNPSFWDPVLPLFLNEYWGRAWVQQEILNASNLVLHSRDVMIPRNSVWSFKAASLALGYYMRLLSDHRTIAWENFCESIIRGVPTDLGNLDDEWYLSQLMSKRLYCSRPQDRVYAVMHLAADYEEGGIAVDYSKNELEVVIDAAAYQVRRHKDVRFLRAAYLRSADGSHELSARLSDEITWIPRVWRGYETEMAILVELPEDVPMRTVCSDDAVSVARRRLRLRGIRVGRVNSCLTSSFDTSKPTAREFWESPWGILLSAHSSVDRQSLPDEVFKILLGIDDDIRYMSLGKLSEHATQGRHFSADEVDNLSQESKDYIDCVIREATVRALDFLSQISQDPQRRNEKLYEEDDHNLSLLSGVNASTSLVLRHMFRYMLSSMVFVTGRKELARMTFCDLRIGDEVWFVLGFDLPIVLRRLLNGRFWHIGAAEIPKMQQNELLQNLSSKIQPGDQVGEWVVEDIELE